MQYWSIQITLSKIGANPLTQLTSHKKEISIYLFFTFRLYKKADDSDIIQKYAAFWGPPMLGFGLILIKPKQLWYLKIWIEKIKIILNGKRFWIKSNR